MKKKKIILSIMCLLMVLVLTGCGSKQAITTKEFKSKTEASGYATYDVKKQFESYKYVKEATIAKHSDGYQVEFYVLDESSQAQTMYNTNRNKFENYKKEKSKEKEVDGDNYETYTLTSDGYYMHICRVDNTFLYIRVKDTYKKPINKLVKDLSY